MSCYITDLNNFDASSLYKTMQMSRKSFINGNKFITYAAIS